VLHCFKFQKIFRFIKKLVLRNSKVNVQFSGVCALCYAFAQYMLNCYSFSISFISRINVQIMCHYCPLALLDTLLLPSLFHPFLIDIDVARETGYHLVLSKHFWCCSRILLCNHTTALVLSFLKF